MLLSCFTYFVGFFLICIVVGPSVVGRGASVVFLIVKSLFKVIDNNMNKYHHSIVQLFKTSVSEPYTQT